MISLAMAELEAVGSPERSDSGVRAGVSLVWVRSGSELDPDQPGGSPVMLPPDQKLAAQLCSVHFTMTPNGIAAEDKIAVIKRLGRSPDKADAVIMACVAPMRSSREPLADG